MNNYKLGGLTHNHRIIPDGVLILKTSTIDIKQNQFLSLFTKLGENFAGKAHM